jgi:uncharacterized protein YegP (UPF0339 family)
MVRFVIFRNQAGEYQWHLEAANNHIVCWSEGYDTRQGAYDSIKWVRTWAPSVPIHDLTQ